MRRRLVNAPLFLEADVQTKLNGLRLVDQRLIFYGPHECDSCGKTIIKLAREQGGAPIDYPSGPIYPNIQWRIHICEAADVAARPKPPAMFAPPAPVIAE
jgi:hypothetical protein